MPSIRCPPRKIVAPAIVCELNPLFTGNIHQVDIGRSRLSRPILTRPCQSQELPVRRPVWRDRISLIGHALLVGTVGLHGVNLRQPGIAAYEGYLRPGLAIPRGRSIRALARGHGTKISAGSVADINLRVAVARR